MRSLFRGERFDGVMVFCPLLGSVAFAGIRKLFFREPLWVNIQDLPAEAGTASGIIKSRGLRFIGGVVQKYLFRCGEVWSSICPEMVAQVEKLKTKRTTVHLVPNWLVGSLADRIYQLPRKDQRRPQQPLKLLYCGTIGKKQGFLEFCKKLQQVCDIDFRFQIHGAGSEANAVKKWVEHNGNYRFEFDDLLSENKFVRKMYDADWFVISEKQGAGFSFLPSKLIPCISVGTPVVAVSDSSSPLGREIKRHGLGITAEWDRFDQLVRQLTETQRSPEKYAELQKNCLDRASAFSREHAIDRVEDLLTDFVICRRKEDVSIERCPT